MSEVDDGGGCECVGQVLHAKSLCFPLNFALNLQLYNNVVFKNEIQKYITKEWILIHLPYPGIMIMKAIIIRIQANFFLKVE